MQAGDRRAGHPAIRPERACAPLTERVSFGARWPEFGRAVAALCGFYALAIVIAGALLLAVPEPLGRGMAGAIAWSHLPLMVGALVANLLWAFRRWRSWKDMGWPGVLPGLRGFGLGLCIGLAMAACAILLELSVGQGRLTFTGEPIGAYAAAAGTLALALLVAALSEELLFRGFPLSRLSDVIGPAYASLLLAFGFSALHAINPNVTVLGLLNVAVASLFLSAVYFRLGGLPAAWGAHFGWNAGLGVGVDAPVSGIAFHVPSIDFSADGAKWITGGAFGPEGGVIGTVVMAAVTFWLGRGVLIDVETSGARGQGSG